MAVNQQLIDRLIAAGMPEAQVRIVVAALANVGSDGGLGTGAGGESTLEQAKESLRVEEEQFELLHEKKNLFEPGNSMVFRVRKNL